MFRYVLEVNERVQQAKVNLRPHSRIIFYFFYGVCVMAFYPKSIVLLQLQAVFVTSIQDLGTYFS
jgi:energy-coupling factor transporter transmembrane protein EcfT